MSELLQGAYDIHVHCNPDVVERVEDVKALAESAEAAGMAGIVLKDHTTNTTGRCYTLNVLRDSSLRFFSAVALNLPLGGVNPVAADAALRAGAVMIYFPTYCGAFHIKTLGLGTAPKGMPLREGDDAFAGYTIFDSAGNLSPETKEIVALIAKHDAVLATGHLSPEESLSLLAHGRDHGVKRMIVTHASEPVPGMTVEQQQAAVAMGAWIEHCFLACAGAPTKVPIDEIARQIEAVGHENCILSSDFGQIPNGPIIAGFEHYLRELISVGIPEEQVRRMIVDNPAALLKGK